MVALLRQPVTLRDPRATAAGHFTFPTPTGGLNSESNVAGMPITDALLLDNFFCRSDFVELRRGHTSHATGLGSAVESLLTWNGLINNKMFGAAGTNIYDVTSSGPVGAAAVTGLTNARWQQAMLSNVSGNYLVICNGEDAVQNYDGTTWTVPTINNVSSSALINVAVFKERLWFVEKNKLDAWYLPVQAIQGDATKFPLGSVFKRGGKLIAIGSLTRDGGDGIDDFCVFVSSEGEVAVYQGTDPSSATTFALVGVFEVGIPIGSRCVQKVGGDLAIITESGILSLTSAFILDRAAQQRATVSSKINELFTDSARAYRSNFGWQITSYPRSKMLLINVPEGENAIQTQFVMNALTGAWSRFRHLNGASWSLLSNDLFFGGNQGTVFKADDSFQDNGQAITADLKTAFSSLNNAAQVKTVQQLRALYRSNGSPGVLLDTNIDFADRAPTSTPTPGDTPTSLWGSAVWGTDLWGGGDTLSRAWVGGSGVGHDIAIRLRVTSNGANFRLSKFDVIYTLGGLV